jgi:single-stranded-DNA-specific exonuclease
LRALIEESGAKLPVGGYEVGFVLAPRINAAGRMGDAADAVKALLSEDSDHARKLAAELGALNNGRKTIEADILREIETMVNENPRILYDRVAVIYGSGWHGGVIGIVSTRITEKFGKPAFIITDDDAPGYAKGSARGVEGFSVYKALSACSGILTKFGGHYGAGGFSLKKTDIPAFNDALRAYAADNFEEMPVPALGAAKVLRPEELNVDSFNAVQLLQPFGKDNELPLFAFARVMIRRIFELSGGAHTKLRLSYGGAEIWGLLFNVNRADFPYAEGTLIDIIAELNPNEYKGAVTIDLKIRDYRKSGVSEKRYFAAKACYERYKRGEDIDAKLRPRIVPDRGDLAAVYKAFPINKMTSCDAVFSSLDADKINYCKFRLSLDIFEELGIMELNRFRDAAKPTPGKEKASLDNSKTFKDLSSYLP